MRKQEVYHGEGYYNRSEDNYPHVEGTNNSVSNSNGYSTGYYSSYEPNRELIADEYETRSNIFIRIIRRLFR